jgi:hypothetical protein
MIGLIVAAAISSAAAQLSMPAFRRHESYAQARRALLARGWRPVETHYRLGDGKFAREFGDAGAMLEAGVKEVYDCSGVGLNFCTFIWKRGKSCVHVITQGEYAPDAGATPGVYDVKRGSCSGG